MVNNTSYESISVLIIRGQMQDQNADHEGEHEQM